VDASLVPLGAAPADATQRAQAEKDPPGMQESHLALDFVSNHQRHADTTSISGLVACELLLGHETLLGSASGDTGCGMLDSGPMSTIAAMT